MKTATTILRTVALALFLFLVTRGKMNLWLIIFALSLLAALFFGRIYCGYLCPMNTVMGPAEWLSKRFGWQAKTAPKWMQNRYLPWLALIVSLASMILAQKVLHKNIPVLLLWLAASFLITLRYHPAVFHNLICPFGALQKIAGRSPRLAKFVHTDRCIGCKKCETVCPSEAIPVTSKKAFITTERCHQCQNCSSVCPTGAIRYTQKTP